jgi:NAD(P)-dependent dehydrogenase (short-subunit alcohol dehydrogenase family)
MRDHGRLRSVEDMKKALITGASRGLGRALASGLAAAGYALVIDARDPRALRLAADAIRADARRAGHADADVTALPGDITDPAHRAVLGAAGGIDLLVNNAGTLGATPLPPLSEYPLGELRVAFEVNVVAPLGLIQDALPLLLSAPHPRVVNITSDAAVEPYEGWGGYGSGKAALEQLSAVLAAELAPLTVWWVDPGDLRTAMHQAAFPGEDISDRPEPASVVPAFLDLIGSDRPSGRYRAAELVTTGVPA